MTKRSKNHQNIEMHYRAANYLTVAQLFLKSNFLLNKKLEQNDIKSPVLGHWGACPGINFLYAHFCRYIQITKSENYFILGSGHAAPALLANLYLEGSLGKIYPDLNYGKNGLYKLISGFGSDSRLQTEVSPALPGTINSGGELGVATACAVGSVLNNSHKSCLCVIGDGEFESGATMSSFLTIDLLSPKKDGFLIFAINLNEYKMGSRSLLSTWSKNRIKTFFESFNLRPFFCKLDHALCSNIFLSISKMYRDWINGKTTKIPIIILKNTKGITGPKSVDGKNFVGSHHSHKVGILKDAKQNIRHINIIEKWLNQYQPNTLFNKDGYPVKKILDNFPKNNLRIGQRLEIDRKSIGHNLSKNNHLIKYYKKLTQSPGTIVSPMVSISNLINSLRKYNKNYLLFSPDEGYSNRIDTVIDKDGIKGHSKWKSSAPIYSDGGVVEVLNEICCHGMLQAYNQTGRDGLYITYEAFAPITTSLISQYYKILKISNLYKWKSDIPSLKYILTSSGWHNCYTHQNPDLLNTLLSKTDNFIDVYFPSDANHALAYLLKMNKKINSIQVMIAGKTNTPILRTANQAYSDVQRGYWIKEYKTKKVNKTIYISPIGDYVTKEVFDACQSIFNNECNFNIKIIIPICSEIFTSKKIKKIYNIKKGDSVIIICSGYANIFRGLFSAQFDTKKWIFAGYKDGFIQKKKTDSVLKINKVDKLNIIKYINRFRPK